MGSLLQALLALGPLLSLLYLQAPLAQVPAAFNSCPAFPALPAGPTLDALGTEAFRAAIDFDNDVTSAVLRGRAALPETAGASTLASTPSGHASGALSQGSFMLGSASAAIADPLVVFRRWPVEGPARQLSTEVGLLGHMLWRVCGASGAHAVACLWGFWSTCCGVCLQATGLVRGQTGVFCVCVCVLWEGALCSMVYLCQACFGSLKTAIELNGWA